MLATGFDSLLAFSPILFGLIVGFFWQVLVMFGLHWSLIPIAILQLGTMGYATALTGMFGASFAQTAAVAAMYFRLKNPKEKALVLPAVISGICGVTEPAIYGLSLPKKKTICFLDDWWCRFWCVHDSYGGSFICNGRTWSLRYP